MDKFPSLPDDRRRLLCEEGQSRIGLAPATIEKDFWVCWTLKNLFNLPGWGEHLTFKGGTSLSKCWQLISRFSEDIDVVIDRGYLGFGEEPLSGKRQKKLVKECSRCIREELWPLLEQNLHHALPEKLTWELALADEKEDPDLQTLLFRYPSVFVDGPLYLRREVKIEMGARSETEPVETPHIQPYLAEAFPDLLADSTFSIHTVAARRTFWEKAMLLHEENFRPIDKPRKIRLSRHYYDLWCLINKGIAKEAMAQTDLFDKVASQRQIFFKQNWVDYNTLRRETLQILPKSELKSHWKQDYNAMRTEMFFDEPPDFDEVLAVIQQFQEELNRS
jgi:hypothetical protein